VKVQFHAFLTLALDGGKWSASCPSILPYGKEPQYTLDRRVGGAQHQSGCRHKEKISLPLTGIEPQLPGPQPWSLYW